MSDLWILPQSLQCTLCAHVPFDRDNWRPHRVSKIDAEKLLVECGQCSHQWSHPTLDAFNRPKQDAR